MNDPAAGRLVTPGFVALAVATLAFFVAAGIVLPVSPTFAAEVLGADELGVGIAIASFSITSLLLRPVVGWASDRFGRRPLLLGGALLTVAALGLHLLAEDLTVFIAARSLLGAGEGFFFVASIAAGADMAPEHRRGEAISFLSLSLYLGIAIGPPIGEAAVGMTGGAYDAAWLIAIGVAVLAVALTWLVPESAPAVLERARSGARGPGARGPLIHPAGLFPGFISLLGLWGMAGFFTFLPLHARQLGMGGAGVPFVLYALVVVVLRVVGAKWPDRYGATRVSGAALVISALGMAIIGLLPSPEGLIAGTFVFAVGVAFIMPALMSLAVSRVAPTERGSVSGTVTVFLDVSFGFAPVALGMIATRAGYEPTFLVSAALAAAGAALLVARRRSLEAPLPCPADGRRPTREDG
ncbi:MAG TPA: MFS transporter [Candidatus Limnocylindrales bacterium]|nr:MFS transporter [Candidatus Limnocylindrales bacterium]